MRAKIYVTLKNGVLDPQGKAIEGALGGLGFAAISAVRVGKVIEMDIAVPDEAAAYAQCDAMARRLLANLVIEDFRVELQSS